MPLANFKKQQQNKTFKRVEFIDLPAGEHIIRILSTSAVVFDTHYIRGATVKCLGDFCPICKNNKSMWAEFGKEASKHPGFINRTERAYLNIFDKTPTKICANTDCGAEVKRNGASFPSTCPKCNASLATVSAKPLNKVKILAKGKRFFEQIELIDSLILDPVTQDRVGINNFDLKILAMGSNIPPTPTAVPESRDVIEVDEDSLFDLNKAIIEVSPEEMLDLVRGVSLSDIFRARAADSNESQTEDAVKDQVFSSLDGLFSL